MPRRFVPLFQIVEKIGTCFAAVRSSPYFLPTMNAPPNAKGPLFGKNTQPWMHGVILFLFCLGFGLLLAVTDEVTADGIAARAVEDKQASLGQVLPDAIHDNNPVKDTFVTKNEEGKEITVYRARKGAQVTGVAYEIYGTGYAGEIKLMMGIAADGTLLGVRVLAHKETPGLGDKIEVKKTPWIEKFTGLSLGKPPVERWKVKKDGGDFDQFAGATITPRGVVGAIRRGQEFFAAHKAALIGA